MDKHHSQKKSKLQSHYEEVVTYKVVSKILRFTLILWGLKKSFRDF